MGSQSKDTRQLQKNQLAALIEKRTALLGAQGKSADQIAKDAPLKKLKGDLKRTIAAVKSIEKRAATVAGARAGKVANAEKRAAARPKKMKNKTPAAAPEAEKKKKKEKKPQ
jgi:hypothetical protein